MSKDKYPSIFFPAIGGYFVYYPSNRFRKPSCQLNDFLAEFFFIIFELGGMTKHLVTVPAGNSEYRFLGFASGNIEGLGEAKLTVSRGACHQVLII